MFRAITLLVVVAVAGIPTASMACDLWCTSAASAAHHRMVECHRSAVPAASGTTELTSETVCHDPTTTGTYLSETRERGNAPLLNAILPPVFAGADTAHASDRVPALTIRLSRPVAGIAVLRL